MENRSKTNIGIKNLRRMYREIFRVPENLNHYSKDDYENAEKLFIKHALLKREVETYH